MTQNGSDIIRKAAEIINQNGWCQGSHARDSNGVVCRILHPDAATFSIYGAVSKALYLFGLDPSDKAIQNTQPMWDVLTQQAARQRAQYTGVHPLMDFNDNPNCSPGEALGFLGDCAQQLETAEKAKTEAK